MFRPSFFAFHTISRVNAVRPAPRFLASSLSHAAHAGGLRTTLRRGAAFALFSAVGVTVIILNASGAVHLDAATPVAVQKPRLEATRTDPDTGIEFPETLVIPSRVRLPPLTLVGLGVRRVSFLGIKVYSVGFYADLANPNLKIPNNVTPEEKVDYIVSNTPCVLRIIPTRSTSYSHLRDGFLRALQARMSAQLKSGKLSMQEAEEAQSPLRKLKSMFPTSPLAKGVPLDIMLLPLPISASEKRTLVVRDLGSVESNWLAK
ncbi:hypothetical protein EW145_g1719 [Phellinidium pouzarii]|uniref:Chalcone isomerase domain-containing protein n=1 Tax=Phellinidium pouzarii TaxID=167371 RepID=A0A4S4LJ03_9AGAM|nr:hypothetical protein EW145_g1719 [Phellinidium pouzarii]